MSGNESDQIGAWKVVVAICCAVGSAIAAGLTLGLMTFDVVQLKILMAAGEDPDADMKAKRTAQFAKRIHYVRKRGNLLLVTLLLLNVAFNSAFSIILGDATSGLVGFIISTSVITIFGEILPQAICVRYGLPIGWFFVPVVVMVEILLFPIAGPLAMILHCVLGQEIGTVYSKKELELLLMHHELEAKVLAREEMKILGGGLHIGKKVAVDAMTPIESVFGLEIDSSLDYSVAMKVFSSGFSRIPVFDHSRTQCIVGVLLVKDLLLLDPTAALPIKSILTLFGRPAYAVDETTSLMRILNDFKKGHTHIAIVRSTMDNGDLDPTYAHVGIITLEDIIEEILQDEILDEFETHTFGNESQDASSCKTRTGSQAGGSLSVLSSGIFIESLKSQPGIGLSVAFDTRDGDNLPPDPLSPAPFVSVPINASMTTPIEPESLFSPALDHVSVAAEGSVRINKALHRLRMLRKLLKSRAEEAETSTTQSPPHASSVLPKRQEPISTTIYHAERQLTDVSKAKFNEGNRVARLGRMRLLYRSRGVQSLTQSEVLAMRLYFIAAIPQFKYVDEEVFDSVVLSEINVVSYERATSLCNSGTESDKLSLLIQGRVKVTIGNPESFESVLGPWSLFGAPSFPMIDDAMMKVWLSSSDSDNLIDKFIVDMHKYIPNYSAIVVDTDTKMIHLSKSVYSTMIKKTIHKRRLSS